DVAVDEPLVRDDFQKDPSVGIYDAACRAHVDAPHAAGPYVELAMRRGCAFNTPPKRDISGVGPDLEDQISRRTEHTGQPELALPRFITREDHRSLPFS